MEGVPFTLAASTGKICYREIPARDIERSSSFYRHAFGWKLRVRGDGSLAFDDTVEQVSGTWMKGRPPSVQPGVMVHAMVADIVAMLPLLRAAGGQVVLDVDPAARERVAHVRDPGGNVIGVYEQRGLAAQERPVPLPPAASVRLAPQELAGRNASWAESADSPADRRGDWA